MLFNLTQAIAVQHSVSVQLRYEEVGHPRQQEHEAEDILISIHYLLHELIVFKELPSQVQKPSMPAQIQCDLTCFRLLHYVAVLGIPLKTCETSFPQHELW